jgi:predicted ATPase
MGREAMSLRRVEVGGLAGLPDVAIELGDMTALIGTRGSGKSQLLAAISWLIDGQPMPGTRPGATQLRVAGVLGGVGGWGGAGTEQHIERRLDESGERATDLPGGWRLRCTFLRAADRLGPAMEVGSGEVGARVAGRIEAGTTDAAAAEALIWAVESALRDGHGGEILLIEEPELLLTPQAQRYLYGLLRRFAEAGNQVVYSTWSPAFVDAAHHEEIVRLDPRAGGTVVRRTDPGTLSDLERVRIQAEFDHERSEMFFAEKVVLVEGQTERLSLPFIFRAMGHDPDAEGIAIVEMGGKGNLPLAARLLVQLAIPFVVVFDGDSGSDSAALDAQIRAAAAGAPTVRFVPDFEGAAGIASHDDKVLHAWQRFAGASPEVIPAPLAEVVQVTVGL